jgi:ApbE superfamily uncharacterized protein (UPF0280 family)
MLYRKLINTEDLIRIPVVVDETNLLVLAKLSNNTNTTSNDLKEKIISSLLKYRFQLLNYIQSNPKFLLALSPLRINIDEMKASLPKIVEAMLRASELAGVGPMAGVAGAIAEFICEDTHHFASDFIIENGGDIFIKKITKRRNVLIYCNNKYLKKNKFSLVVEKEDTPLGICSSSGTFGHSLSLGKADLVVVLSNSAVTADAFATCYANKIKNEKDIDSVLTSINKHKEYIRGIIIIKKNKIGIWGNIKLNF